MYCWLVGWQWYFLSVIFSSILCLIFLFINYVDSFMITKLAEYSFYNFIYFPRNISRGNVLIFAKKDKMQSTLKTFHSSSMKKYIFSRILKLLLCVKRRQWLFVLIDVQPEAEFKEFEPRFKFKPQLKYDWFHLKLYQIFQDLSRRSIETGFWQI